MTNGIYVGKQSYWREGDASATGWGNVVQFVVYRRYVRFYADKRAVDLLSVSDVPLARRRQIDLTDTGENVQKWTRVFKKKKKKTCPLLDVFACGQVLSSRLYRLILFSKIYCL